MVRSILLRTSYTPMTSRESISDLDVIGVTRIARISIRLILTTAEGSDVRSVYSRLIVVVVTRSSPIASTASPLSPCIYAL